MATSHAQLEDALGYQFSNPDLIAEALTHRGFLGSAPQTNKKKIPAPSNERLEFLGDRVLGLVIADELLKTFPEENEGALATRLAALVSAPTLAEVAKTFELGSFIRLAPGHKLDSTESAILADACEAVIGALYVDGGLEAASRFIHQRWKPLVRADIAPPKDSKTTLQEWAQGRGLPLPEYTLVSESGPAHAPEFTVSVTVKGEPVFEGYGRTKRLAEQIAAKSLLDHLAKESQ